jgi:FHS family L-fucose permease-like MFS transporter
MAIVGGAVLPLIVGHIVDAAGLQIAFLVPMLAYACIALFATAAGRARAAPAAEVAAGLAH